MYTGVESVTLCELDVTTILLHYRTHTQRAVNQIVFSLLGTRVVVVVVVVVCHNANDESGRVRDGRTQ